MIKKFVGTLSVILFSVVTQVTAQDTLNYINIDPTETTITYNYHYQSVNPMLINNYFESGFENYLMTDGSASFNSNAVNTSFVNHILNRGFIHDDDKATVMNQLKGKNLFSASYQLELQFAATMITAKSKPYRLFISASQQQEIASSFSDDDFVLGFYGNVPFAGDTARLSPLSFYNYSFRKLSVGSYAGHAFQHVYISLGLSPALYDGINANELQLQHATLFTEANGDFINFEGNMLYHQSDQRKQKIYFSDGIGAGLDAKLRISLNTNLTNEFNFSINNFGFIQWNTNATQYASDTAFTFSGFQISNLLSGDSAMQLIWNRDTLLHYTGTTISNPSWKSTLPYHFTAIFTHQISLRDFISAGFSFSQLPYSNTNYFFRNDWRNRWFNCSVLIAYGKNYGAQFGAMISKTISNRLLISAGSNNLNAFITPKKSLSTSIQINAAMFFN